MVSESMKCRNTRDVRVLIGGHPPMRRIKEHRATCTPTLHFFNLMQFPHDSSCRTKYPLPNNILHTLYGNNTRIDDNIERILTTCSITENPLHLDRFIKVMFMYSITFTVMTWVFNVS